MFGEENNIDEPRTVYQNTLPTNPSQLKHIFRNADGHLADTPENRQKVIDVANNDSAYIGKDGRGNDWYSKINEDGSQTWASSRNGVIQNGGINASPATWDNETGFSRNPFGGRKK